MARACFYTTTYRRGAYNARRIAKLCAHDKARRHCWQARTKKPARIGAGCFFLFVGSIAAEYVSKP